LFNDSLSTAKNMGNNIKYLRTWREFLISYFKAVSWHPSIETEEDHKTLFSVTGDLSEI
jgi:hypothetical protein